MTSYAVVWRTHKGEPTSGRLELEPGALSLHGRERVVEVPYEGIAAVERKPGRELRVERDEGDPLLIASAGGGVGELREILEALVERSRAAREQAASLAEAAEALRRQARHQQRRARRLQDGD